MVVVAVVVVVAAEIATVCVGAVYNIYQCSSSSRLAVV
jgi:hypothetical protein